MNTCILLFGLVILLLVIVILNRRNLDTFISNNKMGQECKIDEDCPGDNFCYMGQCWGYWRGQNMPWSTCRNPYCGSSDPNLNCSAHRGACLPYCKCEIQRQAGGSMNTSCMPKCGNACLNNDSCPPGCPACINGTCQAPGPQLPVF